MQNPVEVVVDEVLSGINPTRNQLLGLSDEWALCEHTFYCTAVSFEELRPSLADEYLDPKPDIISDDARLVHAHGA